MMKRNFLSILLAVVVIIGAAVSALPLVLQVKADAPTEIDSWDQITDLAGSYILTDSITVDKTITDTFTGTLNGNGKTITTSVALFARVENASISNLTLAGNITDPAKVNELNYYSPLAIVAAGKCTFTDITSEVNFKDTTGVRYGSIAAFADEGYDLTFTNCVNKGSISASEYAGGIFGWSNKMGSAHFEDCKNEGSIRSTVGYIGGIVCRTGAPNGEGTVILNCSNTGDLTVTTAESNHYAGGILGYTQAPITISGCTNSGNITTNTYAGGIAGDIANKQNTPVTHQITNCSNSGTIVGGTHAGGIVGYFNIQSDSKINIENCSNDASIIGESNAGGIVGYLQNTNKTPCQLSIKFCTNNDAVSGTNTGGIVGKPGSTDNCTSYISYCINNGSVTGTNRTGGIIGYPYGSTSAHCEVNGCINTGHISSDTFCSELVAYTNSTDTVIKNCLMAGSVEGSGPLSFIGCSSADILKYDVSNIYTNKTASDGFGYVWYSFAPHDDHKSNRIRIADSPVCFIPVSDEQISNGLVASRLNYLIGENVFYISSSAPYITLDTTATLPPTFTPESGIEIDSFNFPDTKFRSYVTAKDTNIDNVLSDSEISGITAIDVSGLGISDLTGIEHFTSLVSLDCSNNNLACLDLSKNTGLTDFKCDGNVIKPNTVVKHNLSLINSFNIEKASEWNNADVVGNIVTKLGDGDVTYKYDCGSGYSMTVTVADWPIEINYTNFPDEWFRSYVENIIDLDRDGLLYKAEIDNVISIIFDGDHDIASLEGIEYFVELKTLDCSGGYLTSLDLSKNTKLTEFNAYGNKYPIEVNSSGVFYLFTLPGNFDVSKASNWEGGTVTDDGKLTATANTVSYDYACNDSITIRFTLQIESYTVIFNAKNDEEVHETADTICYKLPSLPVPTKDGAVFRGWYMGEEKVTTDTVFTQDTTVVAKWTEKISVSYLDAEGKQQTCDAIPLDSELTELAEGWYVVESDIEVSKRITVSGDVHLILADGKTLTAGKGIEVSTGNSITIYGQSAGTGALTATGGDGQAAIGGGYQKCGGTITINGGRVTATAGYNAAGIGHGSEVDDEDTPEEEKKKELGDIIINGGTVTANGDEWGQGLGGTDITITGGSVHAIGDEGDAIGGRSDGKILITGGTVTAETPGQGKAFEQAPDFSGYNHIAIASERASSSVAYDPNNNEYYVYVRIQPAVTVTFDAKGGEVNPASEKIVVGGKLSSIPTPTKTGRVFLGWFTEEAGGEVVDISKAYTENTTIYAQWGFDLYIGGVRVTEDNLEGEGNVGDKGTWKFDPATSTLTLDNFKYTVGNSDTTTTYNFIYSTQELKIVVKGENSIECTEEYGMVIRIDKNKLTISGDSTADKLELIINKNGRSGIYMMGTDCELVVSNVTLDVTASGDGISFSATGSKADISSAIVNVNRSDTCGISCDTINITDSKVTVYANRSSIRANTLLTITNSTVNAKGYITSNYPNTVKIESGTLIVSSNSEYGAFYPSEPFNSLPDTYWWRTDANGDYTASTTQAFSYNKQAYVEITTNDPTITVTFDVNGGDALDPATQKVGIDGKLTSLPVPTKKGFYKFEGWFTAETGGTKVTTDNVYTENTTLYARWSEVLSDGARTVLNVSKGNIVIGDQTVSGYDPDGNHITTPDPDGYILTGTSSVDEKKVWITGGDQILTLRDLSIDVANIKWSTAFNIDGGSHTITLEGKNVLKSGLGCAGLNVNDVSSITITAESTGSLLVRGGNTSRGDIGYRGDKNSGGTININGGKIDANSIGGRSISITGGQFATGDVIAGVVCGRSLPIEYYVKKVDDASCPYLVTTEIPEMLPSDGEKTLLNINHGHAGIGHNVVDAYLNDGTHLTKADPDGYIITGSSNVDEKKVTIFRGEFDIVIRDLSIDVSGSNYAPAFNVESPAKLTLTLEGNNVLKSGKECAGLTLSGDGAALVITADSTGTLTAVGGDYGAGIGSRYWGTCGDITINGGSINARGQNGADAIGAGNGGGCGTITISGGKFAVGDVGAGTVYGIKVADEAEVIYLGDEETYRYSVGMQYNITFDYNDGATASVTEKTKSNGKLTSLPAPTRIGYLFDAWYDAVAVGNKVDTNTVFTADTTIYARWIACNHAASTAKPDCTNGATCSVCGGSISALNHDFAGGPMINNDPAGHYKKCSRCPAVDSANIGYHALANGCDPVCEICGYTRPIWHNYQFKLNDEQHWMACTICGQVEPGTVGGHTGGSANCTDRAVCEICLHAYGEVDSDKHQPPATFHSGRPSDCLTNTYGYSYFYSCVCGERFYDEDCKQPVGGDSLKLEYLHTIKFYRGTAATCCTDGTASYWLCIKCNKKFSDSPAVTEITDLRIPATGAHKASDWSSDEMSHWRICEVGGVKLDAAAHGFGADNVCDTCGYTKPEETTTPPEETTTPPEETTTPPEETTAPPEETTTPPEETTAPPEETTTPPEETTAPPEETTTPPEETTQPPEETTAPPEETTTPPEETTAPPEETTAPPEETTAPPEETTAPPEETTTPPEETTTPPEETTEPPVETTEPPVETTEPPVETTEPAPETTVPDHSGETGDSDSAMIFILLSIISIAAVAFIATRKEKRQN